MMSAANLPTRTARPSLLRNFLQGPFGVLIFGWGIALVGLGVIVLIIGLSLNGFMEWSFDEVARVPDPNANVDAVLVETNGGATTSFGYEVFILPRGQKPERSAHAVVSLYGAIRNDHAYGANLRWTSNDTLVVEYLDAQHPNWLNGSVSVNGRVINIELKSGVNDPTAPSGGMLYNLQGRPRGAVEQIVRREPRERVSHEAFVNHSWR
jgi:hypothetical protein